MKQRHQILLIALAITLIAGAALAQDWQIETLATGLTYNGFGTSLALDSANHVLIAYTDPVTANLTIIHNRDGFWTSEIVRDQGTTRNDVDLVVDKNDNIQLAYMRGYPKKDLGYCTDYAFSSGCETIKEIIPAVSGSCSIGLDYTGRIFITFYDSSRLGLAVKDHGTWTTSVIDDYYVSGAGNNLIMDPDGKAHISYTRTETQLGWNNALMYATNASGSWVLDTVASGPGVNSDNDIALDSNGYVYISYRDHDLGTLNYATNKYGIWTNSVVDDQGSVGAFNSLALDSEDHLHISYDDATNGALKYATNETGSWIISTVDSQGSSGSFTSLGIDSHNRVHISYYDRDSGVLKYATNITKATDVFGQVGLIDHAQWSSPSGGYWTEAFGHYYYNPVVVMRALPSQNGQPAHARVSEVSNQGFKWQIEEWDYLDGDHQQLACPFLVAEAGEHLLDNGGKIKAGTLTVHDGVWQTVTFSTEFAEIPAVLTGIASNNDPSACITRIRDLTTKDFQIMLQTEEASTVVHGDETASWIALPIGKHQNAEILYTAGIRTGITGYWSQTNLGDIFLGPPVYICQDVTFNDPEPAAVRFKDLGGLTVVLKMEEEQSADSETLHGSEDVAFLAWGHPGFILGGETSIATLAAPVVKAADRDPELQKTLPLVVGFRSQYPDPFNPITTFDFTLKTSGGVTLKVFDLSGRLVTSLVDGHLSSGNHQASWNASGQASGVYLAHLKTPDGDFVERMVLLK